MNSTLASSVGDPASPTRVRALVADDDPGSCRFLCDGLASMGAEVATAIDGLSALRLARAEVFDLLILDCRMPGAGALEILRALREDGQVGSAEGIAVATTAELRPADRQPLFDAGFSEILLKPCGLAELQRIMLLVQPERPGAHVFDDQAALTTTGDPATMHALRTLLRGELALLHNELDTLSGNPAQFGERLHRLRSSCGFCGASALSAHVVLVQRQLEGRGATPALLARFRRALLTTLRALPAGNPPGA